MDAKSQDVAVLTVKRYTALDGVIDFFAIAFAYIITALFSLSLSAIIILIARGNAAQISVHMIGMNIFWVLLAGLVLYSRKRKFDHRCSPERAVNVNRFVVGGAIVVLAAGLLFALSYHYARINPVQSATLYSESLRNTV